MLDLNPETVYFIINRAHEFQIKEDATPPDDSLNVGVLDDTATFAQYSGDPVFEELKATIADLEPDQQVSLVGLMWLGRGDYSFEEWDRALQHAGASWNERTAEYLIGTPLLADYLTAGLEHFGHSED